MKKILYILTTVLFISSCTSIQKLVDKGDYDGAIYLAVKKLSGKKNKKTKHIESLEIAFAKVMDRDLNTIQYLKESGDNSNWGRIHSIYRTIQKRQQRIMPFLPLVSKDGYAARFKFIRVEAKLNESALSAADYHYNRALDFMDYARSGDKDAAKKAFYAIDKAEDYFNNYKDSETLSYEALQLGQTRVLVRMYNSADVIIPNRFEDEVLSLGVKDLNDLWTKYYITESQEYSMDYHAILDIDIMDVSPERETVSHHIDSKEIEDGFEYVLDENGNVMKDTLGNDIKVPKKVTITAHVKEFHRHKEAFVEGRLILVDQITGETIKSSPIAVNAVFEDYFSTYRGNRKALCSRTRGMIDGRLLPFPTDFEITLDAAENLKRAMKGELKSLI